MTLKKIPVTILTGFLGSGKTTVLNQLIRNQANTRFMVIENEVGDINIDGALVESGIEKVVELTAGCLCCSLADGLLDALEAVSAKQDEFDHLVIETTGVADPSSMVQTFLANATVERFFELQHIICVVDSGLIEDWLDETDEALRQISMANVILLNKMDTVNSKYLLEIQAKLQAIHPLALLFSGENGVFPYDKIMDTKVSEISFFEHTLERAKLDLNHYQDHSHDHNHEAHDHHHHGVDTFSLSFDQPFVLDDYFSMQLFQLVNLYRNQVYRIKGILYVDDYPNRVILQSVRTNCVLTDGSPWLPEDKRVSQLVFIGKGLKKEAFQKMFSRYTKKVIHEHS